MWCRDDCDRQSSAVALDCRAARERSAGKITRLLQDERLNSGVGEPVGVGGWVWAAGDEGTEVGAGGGVGAPGGGSGGGGGGGRGVGEWMGGQTGA